MGVRKSKPKRPGNNFEPKKTKTPAEIISVLQKKDSSSFLSRDAFFASTNWAGTLLEWIPDMYSLIWEYYDYKARPALKPKYHFKSKFGLSGNSDGRFQRPYAVAVDLSGKFFIADTFLHRVQVFQSDGLYLHSFGSLGTQDGHFQNPSGLKLDFGEKNVIVVDSSNHRIQIFDYIGGFKMKFGSNDAEGGRLFYPCCVELDNDGNFLVSDYRVHVFDPTGMWLRTFGAGELLEPVSVSVDLEGNIVVCDRVNDKIKTFDSKGTLIQSFGDAGTGDGQLTKPWGVTVDSNGKIIVADTENHRIQIFSKDGEFIMKFGVKGTSDGQFSYPRTPTIDKEGNIIVMDTFNHRVQIFG